MIIPPFSTRRHAIARVSHGRQQVTAAFLIVVVGLLQPAGGKTPATAAIDSFRFPHSASPPASRALLLAIDEQAIPFRENVTLYLSKPEIHPEPVLRPSSSPDAPDNVALHFFGSVLHDNGLFRMWYHACHATIPDKHGFSESPVCYAESTDGLNWTRPNLGQVEWRGSRANNIVALGDKPADPSSGVAVIRDDDDPRPERRYKMIWSRHSANGWLVGTAISSDGIRWTALPNNAFGSETVEFASLYKHSGLYIVSGHLVGRGEADRPEGRQGYAIVSPDFDRWVAGPSPSFKTVEPLRGAGYGRDDGTGLYTQVHIGVGAAPMDNVVVGLWGMWHHRQPRWGEAGLNCDLGLVVSHNGIHFDEVLKGFPYIRSEDSPADPVPGRTYPTILCQGNGILNVGDETWIYHSRWRNAEFHQTPEGAAGRNHFSKNYWGAVALARLPRDRWGALALWGDKDAGSAWTMPVTLPANASLQINGTGLDGLRVTVTDENFRPIPAYEQGQTTQPESLQAGVLWNGQNLVRLSQETVRLRFDFKRVAGYSPRLFAVYLTRK